MTIAIRSGSDNGPVTVADVNLKFIWDVVSRIKIGEKGKAYVVDRNGFLVADPDIGLVLRKTDLSHLAHVKAAIGGRRPERAQPCCPTDLAGTRVLTSVAAIEPLGWKRVRRAAGGRGLRESSTRRSCAPALLLLAGLVISALGALALARGMVRPIRTLDEGARRIGAGELDQKIDIHTGDELEGLADQFNRMTGAAARIVRGLERKVDERTRELQSSLEQQTAISEILRVISSSPTDVQPVLEAVAERAAHLCDAPTASVILIEENTIRTAAAYTTDAPASPDYHDPMEMGDRGAEANLRQRPRRDRSRDDPSRRRRSPARRPSIPDARANQTKFGFRAVLAVPLMREGGAYGVDLPVAPRAARTSCPTRSRCWRRSRARPRSRSTTCGCSTKRRRRSTSRRPSAKSCA